MRRASSVAISVKSRASPLRRDRRLAQRKALVVPELLDVLGAADADQLQALEVGRVGQQHVGEVVGLVARVGERDDEREARHLRRRRAAVSQNEIAGLVR